MIVIFKKEVNSALQEHMHQLWALWDKQAFSAAEIIKEH